MYCWEEIEIEIVIEIEIEIEIEIKIEIWIETLFEGMHWPGYVTRTHL